MDRIAYEKFCRDASSSLDLPNTERLGEGGLVDVDGVEMQLVWNGTRHMQLHMEVGALEDQSRLEAYEAALTFQAQLAGLVTGMFVLDVAGDRLMFTLAIPMAEPMEGVDLAYVLRGFAAQVTDWRCTILRGKVLAEV
ncbi:hypothetical protein [Hydrogenophaga sp. BPS33]|uniref:hypothetical protein n=1 Tax=Hydrogenophaga sp. BPS33 TaxID=2651974 RepID=UPI00131FF100|nr:hypothetical protein [Hydrogenophaga sp. BPS33]QHE85616.1 hypothetical protein F9K07_12240 [Hydrogenophaga sp. BPS33]